MAAPFEDGRMRTTAVHTFTTRLTKTFALLQFSPTMK